jgi:hypothetical protein
MDSTFYCDKKKCRKTAWNTPEYLTEDDWVFLVTMIRLLETDDANKIHKAIFNNKVNSFNFFHRVLGWPEGHSYCMDFRYLEVTGIRCMKRSLPELKKSLEQRA